MKKPKNNAQADAPEGAAPAETVPAVVPQEEKPAESEIAPEGGEGQAEESSDAPVPAAAPAPASEEPIAAAQERKRGVRDMPRLMTRIFGTPLLMAPAKIEVIMGALGPRLGLAAGSVDPVKMGAFFDDDEDGDGDCPYELSEDGIATIGVDGTLVYKSSWLGALSGMTGYGDIRASLDAAISDPRVKGILLLVDSYGGEVNGCFDLSDAVFAARSVKPIYGVAADDSYSAAYALLSACSKVFVSRTSGVGSIGVVAMHVDQSAADKQEGLKYTYVHAGEHKVDGNPHEPLSGSAQASIQKECDRLWNLFAGSVAKYRSLSTDAVLGMEAACYFGEEAVAAKLADAVGTPQDAFAALQSDLNARASQTAAARPMFSEAQAPAIEAAAPGPVAAEQEEIPEAAAAAPATADVPEVVNLATERLRMRGEAFSSAAEIIELCALAKLPGKAAEFIRAGMSIEAVRNELQTIRAQASEARPVVGHILPDAGGNESQAAAAGWAKAHAQVRGK